MRLSYLELCGFRGYSRKFRVDFADAFTIIDGRNGVGKSTIFDAIEYALTGTIAKYGEQTASGETVADYIWWKGAGTPECRFVELGFVDDDQQKYSIRREQLKGPEITALQVLTASLCDLQLAPSTPLIQLCQNTIIRDELITTFSMDLKEADRYALLRNALGANDAEEWIGRGARLVAVAKRRVESAQKDVVNAASEVANAARRLDDQRTRLSSEYVIAQAAERLREFANSTATFDQLTGPVREKIAAIADQRDALSAAFNQSSAAEANRNEVTALTEAVESAKALQLEAGNVLKRPELAMDPSAASAIAGEVEDLLQLIGAGRKLGLRDGHCPLCSAERSHEEFLSGLTAAEALARRINENAVRASEKAMARSAAEATLASSTRALNEAEARRTTAIDFVAAYDKRLLQLGVAAGTSRDQLFTTMRQLGESLSKAQHDLRIIETVRGSDELARAIATDAEAKARSARAQERLGKSLKAASVSQTIHDAARRSASETLDLRLERVLPLMSELYRRLRPHPNWSEIEYSIRGDVRRFLKLQVGDNLNPQFLFSSGQRRATGLAFLLSINLSLAWSKWRSILLDDPVQHIDDFRTVHLAELLAQLVTEGRQIICTVEDSALADLFCRRLPTNRLGDGKRVSLGVDLEGIAGISRQLPILPLPRNVLSHEIVNIAAPS